MRPAPRSIAASASSEFFAVRVPWPSSPRMPATQLADVFFVVDDENVARHHAPLVSDEFAVARLDIVLCACLRPREGSDRTQAPRPSGASSSSSRPP